MIVYRACMGGLLGTQKLECVYTWVESEFPVVQTRVLWHLNYTHPVCVSNVVLLAGDVCKQCPPLRD